MPSYIQDNLSIPKSDMLIKTSLVSTKLDNVLLKLLD